MQGALHLFVLCKCCIRQASADTDFVMQRCSVTALHTLAHPPSIGLPEPLKTLPIISLDTGVFNTCRWNTAHDNASNADEHADMHYCLNHQYSKCADMKDRPTKQKRLLTSPVNSRWVPWLSMPDVPSKTCTTALEPSTSSTWPRLVVPSPSLRLTISAYLGFCRRTQLRIIP